MKEDSDLVSIITPAWKAAKVIGDTIASVRAQTYEKWEMIIVDDCSPDDTYSAAEIAANRDERIRLIRQQVNGGPAAARNAALNQAQGRWVAFLDSDDLWLPEKLEHQIQFHEMHDAKISFTEFRRISPDGALVGKRIHIPNRLNYRGLLGNTAIATSTVLIDRKLTGLFQMKNIYYDDFGCWLDILRSGGWAIGLHEDLMRYRVMGESVSRNKRKSASEVWKTYRKVEKLNPVESAWHFSRYAIHGLMKYWHF